MATRVGRAATTWLLPVLLLLLVLLATTTILPDRKHLDDVGLYEERFGRLRSRIPAGETVGLLTNLPAGGFESMRELFLAQYVLAPAVVVIAEKQPPLVIVDVYADQPPLPAGALAGLEPVIDLGNGVVLHRRAR